MGFFDLFKPKADTIGGTIDSATGLVKGIRDAVGKEMTPAQRENVIRMTYELETTFMNAKQAVVTAEINGQSWLQRNWRPLAMMWFLVLLSMIWFGFRPANMTEAIVIELMELLKLGLGGYIITQGAETVADKWNKT